MSKEKTETVGVEPDTGPLVTGSNGKTRKPRQGDEVRPRCTRCSTDEHPVYHAAMSTRTYYTYYQCPVCHDRTKVARYEALQRMQRREQPESHSAR